MKQVATLNKKWILTTSLLAVLVTQYSYQSSTQDFKSASILKNSGEFVLASTSSGDKTSTEANNSTDCKDCKTFVLSPTNTLKLSLEDYSKLLTQIKIEADKTQPAVVVPAIKTVVNDSDCELIRADETRSERRERLQCEKDEKAHIKLEKENDKKQARLEKFEDKMEALKDRCADDLECLSSGFTTALSRFEGSNAVPAAVVTKAFNSVVGVPFKKALTSNDPEALANVQSLFQDMPESYKALKQAVINAVKTQTTISASKVSAQYAALNELSKQNKPEEYFEALATTQQNHQGLNSLVLGYSASIEQGLESAGDLSTIAYYQKSYVPDMKKIMAGITSGITTETKTVDSKTNTRNSRNETVTNNGTSSTELPAQEKMTRNNNGWNFPSTTQGLEVGPKRDDSRGTRRPQRQ